MLRGESEIVRLCEHPITMRFGFDNSYGRLPGRFFACVKPTAVAAPRLVMVNVKLAARLGLDAVELAGVEGVLVLGGNMVAAGV